MTPHVLLTSFNDLVRKDAALWTTLPWAMQGSDDFRSGRNLTISEPSALDLGQLPQLFPPQAVKARSAHGFRDFYASARIPFEHDYAPRLVQGHIPADI